MQIPTPPAPGHEAKPEAVSDELVMIRATQAQRYIPLLCWVIVVLTLVMLSLKVMGLGFLPGGDARRHVAKVFTDKPYADIVIMRPEYQMDHSPGWEWLLHVVHRQTGWGVDALMGFSIVFFLLCIFLIPLRWLRRPEAWLAALLAVMVTIPELMDRFVQARPFLLTEGLLMAILFSWSRSDLKKISWPQIVLTSVAIAISVWVHGAWYLWVLPLAAFFLAGWWRSTLWLTVCFAAGTLAGATLTGHPVTFLKQAVDIVLAISNDKVPSWMLVGEFQPSYGEFAMLTLVAVVFLWRKQQKTAESRLYCAPLLWLIGITWVLGFRADRFWADWGMPAVIVWLALQFEEILGSAWNAVSSKRLIVAGFLAVPLFLHTTNDLNSRYTQSFREPFLDGKDEALQGWTPEPGGIFYHAQMQFFYNTFYKNPNAEWRYILGFEPALMKEVDLKTFHTIQWNPGQPAAYEPWIKKMSSADRLAVYSTTPPNIPQLEWRHALGNIWIGRLPRSTPN